MKRLKNKMKKGTALLLAITLVLGLLPTMQYGMIEAQATEDTATGKTIAGLGTDVMKVPTAPAGENDVWQGSYVYFGVYDGNPVKYRVLAPKTEAFGGTTMLIDCDSILWRYMFDGYSLTTKWADSDIKRYLNSETAEDYSYDYSENGFLTTSFSKIEQGAIAESTKSAADSKDGDGQSALNYASLNGEQIFVLDAKEATNTSYGYYNTVNEVASRVKTMADGYACWWLRSPDNADEDFLGFIGEEGYISETVAMAEVGVSPSLNVNLSSVIFSSVIAGTAGATNAEYKLTLLDSNMTIARNGDVTRSGDTVTIPYSISGTNSGNATQVSVLILNKEYTAGNTNGASVLAYGALEIGSFSITGTGKFTLPAEFSDKVCGRDYYAYIIAEDVNGTYETDYASTPVKISIPWTSKTMNLGTNGIIDPIVPTSEADAWTGCYVYFGTYNGSPVKYRVLDSNTTVFGGTTMLLDCDSILWAATNSDGQSSAFATSTDKTNVWANSTIRTYLNGTFLTSNFSTAEQSAIASSTKSAADSIDGNGWSYSLSYASLINDKIFFLDAMEATNTSYGYSNTKYSATNRVKTGGNGDWWLRSADNYSTRYAGCVTSDGDIYRYLVHIGNIGVSPALNVNLSSVIFSSASGTSKSMVLTADSSQIGTTTTTEWKLTLLDTGKTIKVTDNEKVIKVADGTITVPYTYTDTAEAEEEQVNQISVMITDKEYTDDGAEILYYGALQGTDFTTTSGTGTFELPSNLEGKTLGTDYHVYILAEYTTYRNDIDDNATDYASAPVEIDVYDEIASVDVKIDAPVANTALDTTAKTSSEGLSTTEYEVVWTAGGETVTGNAKYNTTYTASVTLKPDSTSVFAGDVTVTANGVTASLTKNADGSITVSYTFPATGNPVIPDTGDNTPIGLSLMLLIGSGLTAVGFWKKKNYIVEE